MGAWGTGVFQDDAALDWAGDFCGKPDVEFIRRTLMEVVDADPDGLDSHTSAAGLAAAEAVAALRSRPGLHLPEDLERWIDGHRVPPPEPSLVSLAGSAVRRVGDRSELKDLWEEAELEEWLAVLDDLLRRLA
jgi:hypothetical protein